MHLPLPSVCMLSEIRKQLMCLLIIFQVLTFDLLHGDSLPSQESLAFLLPCPFTHSDCGRLLEPAFCSNRCGAQFPEWSFSSALFSKIPSPARLTSAYHEQILDLRLFLKECSEGSTGFGFRLRVQLSLTLKLSWESYIMFVMNCIFPQFYVEVPSLRTSSMPIFRERTFKEIINLKWNQVDGPFSTTTEHQHVIHRKKTTWRRRWPSWGELQHFSYPGWACGLWLHDIPLVTVIRHVT